MSDPAGTTKQSPSRDGVIFAALILLLTAAVALAWSHAKLLSQDEIFVLQTDSVRSVAHLIRIQRHYPISLDPLVYHLLAHACTKLLGPTPLALRLPSIFGFLLMQLCIFIGTRRIAGAKSKDRAALIAMAFPAFTATLFYAPEARPYGLLLGLYALAFVAWQSATRASAATENPTPRTRSLILLALAIALTLNAHYFGILILIPLCLAELARTFIRRKLDIPVTAAILIGMASIVFTLPFQRAAAEFRKHYYNAGAITIRAVSQAYRSLFVSYGTQSLATQHAEAVLLVLFALAVIALCILRLHRGEVTIPTRGPHGQVSVRGVATPELIFLIALAALPLFGVALALFVTHSIEVRYVLAAVIAIAIFFAIAIEPSLRNRLSPTLTTALLLLGILAAGVIRIRDEHAKSDQQLALLKISPSLKAQLLSLPDQHLYIQDMGRFEVASYYEPDPDIRSRIALLYSRPEELRYDFHDTASLTAEHMQHFIGFRIVSYAQLKTAPGEHMLVLYHSGWDWTDQALAADQAQLTPLGPALDGDAVLAHFR